MPNLYDTILRLTSDSISEAEQWQLLGDFADAFGWRPSDKLSVPQLDEIASTHLVVEHGLENTAVLSFLRSPREYSHLTVSEKSRLLELSYNNLVDWHIPIGATEAYTVYNRVAPTDAASIVERVSITRTNVDRLRSELFEEVIGKRPNPNIPALDNALIDTISSWKRKLSFEFGGDISNESLSALFNGIIFARAVEDHNRRISGKKRARDNQSDSKLLLNLLAEAGNKKPAIRRLLLDAISRFIPEKDIPDYLLDADQLRLFDRLDRETLAELVRDFYRNQAVPYSYDFSVMSKHALSRIYEHYVSILRNVELPGRAQLAMFPQLPEEEKSKAYGSIYTPQFVARFFAKFLKRQMVSDSFLRSRATDPACGSGIFLRTLLELRFESQSRRAVTNLVRDAFQNVLGVDYDENAVHATRLSLALLYQVLTNTFPKSLNIHSAEAVDYFLNNPRLKDSQEAVMANPPFVSLETQPEAIRERNASFMAKYASGRIDAYLPFLRIGVEMLKPGGYGMFVLPHSFLLAKSASRMRQELVDKCWIHCLADLSAIRVFGQTRSYVILLIFQKKVETQQSAPPATVVKCQDLVGRALQDALERRFTENASYSVYEVGQESFSSDEWTIVPPTESVLQRRFKALPVLGDFLDIHQGFNSGADDIFTVPAEIVAEDEREIFVPYLPDRNMRSYKVPDETSQYFFYPYIDGHLIDERELKKRFPNTWDYLSSFRPRLSHRTQVRKGKIPWWRPERPRSPESMMRPKVVSPHLVVVPRFSIDLEGKYAISRSPFLYPKDTGAENDLLRYFVAVLNSAACFWHISTHSHVYRSGYVMLEPKTLKKTPVPDPTQIDPRSMRRILKLVDKRLASSGPSAVDVEREIDHMVADLYDLSREERRGLGMEG